jgi:predicted cobalt transporter CbtA
VLVVGAAVREPIWVALAVLEGLGVEVLAGIRQEMLRQILGLVLVVEGCQGVELLEERVALALSSSKFQIPTAGSSPPA